ncbi:HAD family hydrolase [Paracoccus aminophilus]|uniref:HAD family hydrolase n=1 Tax=Paracoccus aminophilus JCM 7686 TaxID=1367847 RepID=S5Y0T2_PARAH|nr:HAD family phosphatase [Paracoccus aminophilus]AGT11102.1 HAD family hydrolase [Paracoccus aminophilus JCM 7686]
MIDLLIFDCDGVLIDSEPLASACMFDAFTSAGVQTSVEEVHRLFTGLGQAEARELARTRWNITEMDPIFAEMNAGLYPRFARELTEMPGISALLGEFRGMRKCVASNSLLERLRLSLGLLPIWSEFAPHVYSAEQVAQGKPAPDLIELCLSRMETPAPRALMIDDSPHGILAARAAGVLPIGFVDPRDPRSGRVEVLRAAGAVEVATGTAELGKVLREICG